MTELTLKDIRKAIDDIKENCEEEAIYEDEVQIIWGRNGTPTKIQFKKKGMKLIKELIGYDKPRAIKNIGKVKTIYGIPIVESKLK